MDNMQTESVYDGVVGILRRVAGSTYSGPISPGMRLVDDLGFDSVNAIRIMLELDRTFGIDVAAKSDTIDIASITTVQDLVVLVRRLS